MIAKRRRHGKTAKKSPAVREHRAQVRFVCLMKPAGGFFPIFGPAAGLDMLLHSGALTNNQSGHEEGQVCSRSALRQPITLGADGSLLEPSPAEAGVAANRRRLMEQP